MVGLIPFICIFPELENHQIKIKFKFKFKFITELLTVNFLGLFSDRVLFSR